MPNYKYKWFNGKEWVYCNIVHRSNAPSCVKIITYPSGIEYHVEIYELRKVEIKEKPIGFLRRLWERYNLERDFKCYLGICNLRFSCFKERGYTQMIHPCNHWLDINSLALKKTNDALESLGLKIFEESGITMISWGDDDDD